MRCGKRRRPRPSAPGRPPPWLCQPQGRPRPAPRAFARVPAAALPATYLTVSAQVQVSEGAFTGHNYVCNVQRAWDVRAGVGRSCGAVALGSPRPPWVARVEAERRPRGRPQAGLPGRAHTGGAWPTRSLARLGPGGWGRVCHTLRRGWRCALRVPRAPAPRLVLFSEVSPAGEAATGRRAGPVGMWPVPAPNAAPGPGARPCPRRAR